MGQKDTIFGLDIGTTKVSATLAQLGESGIEILAMAKVTNTGLRKGQVVDIGETVSSISAVLEDIERIAQIPAQNAIVSIGGAHIETISSKGVIAVARPDGEITPQDVDRVLEASRAVAMPANREIIHVLPRSFTVDAESGIIDPVGMTGIRLEVEAHVISCASAAVKNLVRAVNQAGLQIQDLVFSPLASAEFALNKRQKESGVVLIDIGAGTTSVAVYEEGDLVHATILPVGSMHITHDIAIGLKTSIDLAEAVKIRYGNALKDNVRDVDTIDLTVLDPKELQRPKAKYVAEIVEARLGELFLMIKEELSKIGKDGTLPAGAILTGGGSQLNGLVSYAKQSLHLPVKRGVPLAEYPGNVDKLDDPTYATSIGLILWAMGHQSLTEISSSPKKMSFDSMEGVVGKAKDFFKQLLP
ncbi:cell division protein FtsA [Candidatus Berkelbacteria bacterium]|nr:cell division protein FtsA [Candidatus Berkelbacteria bacterium]